jgi:hypothetical protein
MTIDEAEVPKRGAARPRKRNRDTEQINGLVATVLKSAGGLMRFKKVVPLLLRQSIDEVIDAPRTNRSALGETKVNERIYLGTKVKVRLRGFLKLPKGRTLDLSANGIEVGIQSTIRQNWCIPRVVNGHPCVLIRFDVNRSICSIGAIMVRGKILSASRKPSGRRMISCSGSAGIRWILKDEPLPELS